MNRSTFALTALLAASMSTSCGSGGSPTTPTVKAYGLRHSGTRTAGAAGDALATSLWQSTGAALANRARPAFTMANGQLAAELRFRADAHIEGAAFGVGGPKLEGSARIRRLAGAPNAPADTNGNGTNLDEVLAADVELMAATAGGTAPELNGLLFSWGDGLAEFAAPVAGANRVDYGRLGTRGVGTEIVSMEQIGQAMRARVMLACALLKDSRGSLAGANADDGVKGLLLMQQAVAMQDTLLEGLFHDGRAMGRVDPKSYTATTPQWLPNLFRFVEEQAIPAAPASYFPLDQAGSLQGLAAVLAAASDLAWAASSQNPHPALRDVLNGHPFGEPPEPVRGRGQTVAAANGPTVPNWKDDVSPILNFWCASCHYEPPCSQPFCQPQAGYSIETYNSAFTTGIHNATNPPIVKGDHRASLLWQVLVGVVPGVTVTRMPRGLTFLSPGETDIIADWIDAGAPEFGPPPTEAPAIGLDLAGVLLANIEGLHLDPSTGALHDRHEGDAPSGYAAAGSTGDTLLALVGYLAAEPNDARVLALLQQTASYAAATLADVDGHVYDAVEIASGAPQGPADLVAHAKLTAGLLSAGRELGSSNLLDRGRELAAVLLAEFGDGSGLFRSDLFRVGRRYTPDGIAAVLDALRQAAGSVPGAGDAHDAFLQALRPMLAYSEWDGRGEVLGDGVADTDGNGVPEPELAGGAHGLAPVFAGEILQGPPPSAEPLPTPVTWSQHIQPLLRNKCAQCHLDGARRGDYRIDTPTLLRVPGESAGASPLIVPGDPEASLFYRKLVDRVPSVGVQMPEAQPPLSEAGKALVYQWILEGATSR